MPPTSEEFEQRREEARALLDALAGVLDQAADHLDFGDPAEVAAVLRDLARRFEVGAQRVAGAPEGRDAPDAGHDVTA